jgi:hypothetical protein
MQQFIPFEDDWDALEHLRPDSLIPYHVGVPCRHDLSVPSYCTVPTVPSIVSSSPICTPICAAVPPGNSNT